jgi:hypothetical protein
LTREEAETYLETRRGQGYNTILVELIEHYFSTTPPKNAYGQGPFVTPGDFGTPNEAYFAHAEWVIARALEKGMLVLLTPAYMGYGGGAEGWYQEMQANGVTKLRNYGRYLGTRFAAYPNIMWVHGGDYLPPDRTGMRAIAEGIREISGQWLHTFHGSRVSSALGFLGTSEAWLTVNNWYADRAVVSGARTEYTRSTMPYFLSEARYEGDGTVDEVGVRRQAYQVLLSGATGHLMGHKTVWQFLAGWGSALTAPGAATLRYAKEVAEARAWWTWVPDLSGALVSGGVGSAPNEAVGAWTTDRTGAVVYLPTIRTITVQLGQLTGPRVAARWYDPTTGSYQTIPGSPFTGGTAQTFRPTANNARNKSDWVLILDSTP